MTNYIIGVYYWVICGYIFVVRTCRAVVMHNKCSYIVKLFIFHHLLNSVACTAICKYGEILIIIIYVLYEESISIDLGGAAVNMHNLSQTIKCMSSRFCGNDNNSYMYTRHEEVSPFLKVNRFDG